MRGAVIFGLALAGTLYAINRLIRVPSFEDDDLSDTFLPAGFPLSRRAAPAAVPPFPAAGANHFWGVADDEGFLVTNYFDGSFHEDEIQND